MSGPAPCFRSGAWCPALPCNRARALQQILLFGGATLHCIALGSVTLWVGAGGTTGQPAAGRCGRAAHHIRGGHKTRNPEGAGGAAAAGDAPHRGLHGTVRLSCGVGFSHLGSRVSRAPQQRSCGICASHLVGTSLPVGTSLLWALFLQQRPNRQCWASPLAHLAFVKLAHYPQLPCSGPHITKLRSQVPHIVGLQARAGLSAGLPPGAGAVAQAARRQICRCVSC